MKELTVEPELKDWLHKLTASEMNRLRENILKEGCRDAIVTWANHDNTIIDGHHRYQICVENDIPFKTKALQFDSIEEVKAWMFNNQDGRRNMTKAALRYKRGMAYLEAKQSHGATVGDGRRAGKTLTGQNDHLKNTSELLAKQYCCSEVTIRRDAKFAEQLNEIPLKDRNTIIFNNNNPLPDSEDESQCDQILKRLGDGPATTDNLSSIAPKYTGRISDLRERGKNIIKENGLYWLKPGKYGENGEKKKKRKKDGKFEVVIRTRFDIPADQAGAINRVQEIVKECQKCFKHSSSYKINYNKFHKLVYELGELMQVFRAAK